MAKKKVAKKKAATSRPSGNSKKSVAKKTTPKSAPVAGAQQRSLTSYDIGHVAGDIWLLLKDKNDRSLASIKKSIDAPDVLILAAIGWLAREDKLHFNNSGRSTSVALR